MHPNMNSHQHKYNHGHACMHETPDNKVIFSKPEPGEINSLGYAHAADDDKSKSCKQQDINNVVDAAPARDFTEEPSCGFLDKLPVQCLVQDIKETYCKACDLVEGDPQKRPLIHQEKKSYKQKNVENEFKSGSFHLFPHAIWTFIIQFHAVNHAFRIIIIVSTHSPKELTQSPTK